MSNSIPSVNCEELQEGEIPQLQSVKMEPRTEGQMQQGNALGGAVSSSSSTPFRILTPTSISVHSSPKNTIPLPVFPATLEQNPVAKYNSLKPDIHMPPAYNHMKKLMDYFTNSIKFRTNKLNMPIELSDTNVDIGVGSVDLLNKNKKQFTFSVRVYWGKVTVALTDCQVYMTRVAPESMCHGYVWAEMCGNFNSINYIVRSVCNIYNTRYNSLAKGHYGKWLELKPELYTSNARKDLERSSSYPKNRTRIVALKEPTVQRPQLVIQPAMQVQPAFYAAAQYQAPVQHQLHASVQQTTLESMMTLVSQLTQKLSAVESHKARERSRSRSPERSSRHSGRSSSRGREHYHERYRSDDRSHRDRSRSRDRQYRSSPSRQPAASYGRYVERRFRSPY